MIDLQHPLAVLATRMPWPRIEEALAPVFARKSRPGQAVAGQDLFGPTLAVAGAGASGAGRPRLPIRLMVGLLYLKHAFNGSDESVCERWAQNNYWQYFCGQEYFQPCLPCDPTNLVRFRQALGEAGVEELLATTIATAVQMKAVTPVQFERVIVDTTVQEKAVAYPTDSRLREVARAKPVQLAQRAGLGLKQTYEREGQATAPSCRRLCTCETLQAPTRRAQAPTHHFGPIAARHRAQVVRRHRAMPGAAARVARARLAHPPPAEQRQEQAVRAARARSRVHRQRQGPPTV